jgi:hypothetical protein
MWEMMVGIELGRAIPQVEGYQPRPFGCEVGSHFHHRPRFPRPPVSSRTVGFPESGWRPWRFPEQAFPLPLRLKCRPTCTPHGSGLPAGSTSPGTSFPRAQRPGTSPLDAHHAPRAPLPLQGVTPQGVASPATWKGITLSSSLIRAHAPDQLPPPHFGLGLAPWVLAGCCQPLLGDGPSQRYLRKSFPRCLDPYPGGTLWCVRPFLPIQHRPSPHNSWVGSHNEPYSDFTTGVYFGAAVIPSCSGPQVCSPPRSLLPQSLDEAGQP